MSLDSNNVLLAPLDILSATPFYPRVPNISLELTNHCNLHCPYCAHGTLTRRKGYIDWEVLEKIVIEAGQKRLNISHLHGVGEPLLWNRLEDVIRLIRVHDAGSATFGTNGTLMTRLRAAKLLDAGLTSVYFSVDTLDDDLYKKTRGGDLSRVIENIKTFIEFAPADFPVIIALMNHKDQHLNHKILNRFHEIFGMHSNVTMNPVENAFFPSAKADYRVKPERSQTCTAPKNYLFIDMDGNAAVCCLDQDVLHSLGNVAERSITDVWFDAQNQTHFRNMALGVGSVPCACVDYCILLPPRQNVTHAPIGLTLPFDVALFTAKDMLANGDKNNAKMILSSLMLRDSQHQEVNRLYYSASIPV